MKLLEFCDRHPWLVLVALLVASDVAIAIIKRVAK